MNEDKSINLYLNPSNKFLVIDNLPYNEVYNLTIYDMNGSERINQKAKEVRVLIDINHLQKGLYILRINNQESIESRKFIVK